MARMTRNRRRNPLEGEFDLGGIRGPEADEQESVHVPAYVAMAAPAPVEQAPEPALDEEEEEQDAPSESNGPLMFLLVAGGLAAAWYWWSSKSTPAPEKMDVAAEEEEDVEPAPESQPVQPKAPVVPRATAPLRQFEAFRPRIAAGATSSDPRTAMLGTRLDTRPPTGRR